MKVHFPNKLKLSNKTLVLTKIPKNTNPTVDENISSLFANPNTYLQLPEESKFSFVIGRRLKGPRFDENDNLIPYSIVGEKYFKKKKNLFNNNNSESISFNRSTVRSNTQKLNNNNLSEYINDYQLKNIFNNFKENIEKNKYNNNNNDELYKTINLPKCLEKNLLTNHLNIQEKNLENFNNIQQFRKNFIKKKEFKKHNNHNLLLNKSDNFRLKKESLEFLYNLNNKNNKNNNYPNIGNGLQNWAMGLRRPKNFKGIRRGYVNIGNDIHPFWSKIQEKYPVVNENIVIPINNNETNNNNNNNNSNILFTRTLTENISRNMFNNTLSSLNNNYYNYNLTETSDFNRTNRDIKLNMNKTLNISKLDVQGKKLIDVEENIIKEMKGKKKKMVKFKYDKDMLKDLNIKEEWDFKGKIIN